MNAAFKIEAREIISTLIGSGVVVTETLHTGRAVHMEESLVGDIHSSRAVVVRHISPTPKIFGDMSGGQIDSENGSLVRGEIDLDALNSRTFQSQ